MATKTAPTYTGTAKLLHWLIVALLIVQFIIAWTMPHIGRNTPLVTMISLHFSFGVLILGVTIIRLIWWATHIASMANDIPDWQRLSALLVRWLLYLSLFALPILGWLNASWRGYPVSLFGTWEMSKLVETHSPGWQWTGDLHAFLSNYVLLTLVGLHVLAALYHYFIRRDGVLQRMLPSL
jgi:cytochrome b561